MTTPDDRCSCGNEVEVPLIGAPYAFCHPCLDASEGDER